MSFLGFFEYIFLFAFFFGEGTYVPLNIEGQQVSKQICFVSCCCCAVFCSHEQKKKKKLQEKKKISIQLCI